MKKLMSGGAVRVKHGTHHKVHLTHAQHKKHVSAHKKGKGHLLSFDPYQMSLHGGGVLEDIGNAFTHDLPSALIHQGLPEVGSTLGAVGGEYFGGPLGAMVGSAAGRRGGNELGDYIGKKTGYGLKETLMKHARAVGHKALSAAKHHLAHHVAPHLAGHAGRHLARHAGLDEHLGQMAGEEGAKELVRMSGLGRKKHHRKGGSLRTELEDQYNKIPVQYHAPIEQIGSMALHDLGFGLRKKRRRKKHGGALMAAGY
jgi:hypothetical protein